MEDELTKSEIRDMLNELTDGGFLIVHDKMWVLSDKGRKEMGGDQYADCFEEKLVAWSKMINE